MSRSTNLYEDLRRAKRDLKRLRSAIPKLMRPEELLDRIVTKSRDVLLYSSIVDKLHRDVPSLSTSSERWGELERDAQIFELKAENCEIRLLHLRLSLRTLHATAPLLIATGKTSAAAWETMLEQPKHYYDAEGRRHDLPIQQDTIERIIADQLQSINDLHTTLRNVRSTILYEERAQKESNLEKMTASINAIQNSIEELTKKVNSQPTNQPRREAEVIESPRREEPMEASESTTPEQDHDDQTMNFMRRSLEAKIHILEIRIEALRKKQPCRPREFATGMDRSRESRMRCVFCGTRGDHYSDSCRKVRDSNRRKLLLKDDQRCLTCLEIGCPETEACPKYWTKCYHCGQLGHHSAICEKPDIAQQIEDDIKEVEAELQRTKAKANVIRQKLGLDAIPSPTHF